MDKANIIHDMIYKQLILNTKPNMPFEGFKIYRDEPIREGIVFPCIMMVRQEINDDKIFFGEEAIKVMQIDLNLAFRARDAYIRKGDETFDTEKLVYEYIARLDKFYDELDFGEGVNIENIMKRVEPMFPLTEKSSEYGCVYTIGIYYEK